MYNQWQKDTWTKKSAQALPHFFFPVAEQAITPMLNYYGDAPTIVAAFCQNEYAHWYWNDADLKRLSTSFLEKVHSDPNALTSMLQEWKKRVRAFEQVMQKIDQTALEELTNQQLLLLYQEWYKAYLQEYTVAVNIQDAFTMQDKDLLQEHFKKIIPSEKFTQYYLILTTPTKGSFATTERKERLEILKEAQTLSFHHGLIDTLLEEHAQKWHWIHNNYAIDKNLTAQDFKDLLMQESSNPTKELQHIQQHLQQVKQKKQHLITELNLDATTKDLITLIDTFAYMQDERKKYVLLATHYQNRFLKEIQQRTQIPLEDLHYTIIHELEDVLLLKKLPNIAKRKEAFLVINTRDGYRLYEGEEAKDLHKHLFAKETATTSLLGTIASQGKARGRVKIILTQADFTKFNKGDILVASMTRPDYVPLMQKAAAIITNEGGITSHAAVVSREFKIPCIIGTKHATTVLKDNQEVEVDAHLGKIIVL